MALVAFSSGLWAAWRPDGRLQGSTGSGLCSHPLSAEVSEDRPVMTQCKHRASGACCTILGVDRSMRNTSASQETAL